MNIVLGYTNALDDRLDGSDEYVERIRTGGERVVDLVQNVQVLVRSLSGDLEVDAVGLSDLATRQVERARKTHDATFHTDLIPWVTVATIPFISSAVDNLLTNVVVPNPVPEPEVTVRVDRTDDTGSDRRGIGGRSRQSVGSGASQATAIPTTASRPARTNAVA